MGDEQAKDTEVTVNLSVALDERINVVEVIDVKLDTAIEPNDKLNNSKIKEFIVCGCGGHYINRNKTRHMKTKKHISYEEKATQSLPSTSSC